MIMKTQWADSEGIVDLAYRLAALVRRPQGTNMVRELCKMFIAQCDVTDAERDAEKAHEVAQAAYTAAFGAVPKER